MSWSVSAAGNKDKVRQVVSEQFDAAARNYVGQEEAIDVITAKERVLACIDGVTTIPTGYDGVFVNSHGSRSVGWSVSLHVEVSVCPKPADGVVKTQHGNQLTWID